MKRLLVIPALAFVACTAMAMDEVNTVFNAQKERMKTTLAANAERLRACTKDTPLAGARVVPFAVPAMSDVMRIADVWPEDGRLGGPVRVTLAQGESESGSFELFSFEDLKDVKVELSPVTLGGGQVELPADLRVVKVWFQNGNGWVSYFDDCGLKLVPELLLHDENLIDVDLEKAANYARVMKDGKATKVWISAPKGLDAGFDAYDPGFRDAETMQPVALAKNAFKQFFVTFRAAKGQVPGVYRGKVTVTAQGKSLAEVPFAVRVLPFELPLPRGYQNYDQPYFFSAMGSMPDKDRLIARCGGDVARGERCFRNWLQSLYDHSVFHGIGIGPKNIDCLPLVKAIGFPLNIVSGDLMLGWFGLNFGGRMSFRQLMTAKDAAQRCKEFYDRHLPGSEIWCGHGDEQGTAFVTAHREFFKYYVEKGIRIGCAGHDALMIKGGYAYGYYPMGGYPNTLEKARPWHEINGKPVGFYASQHNGSENPQFVRMQHGLLGYFSGLTMTFNYEFATESWSGGSWSDRANECYKPMVVTHANGDGLMETLAYAGFREACDDIRYATCLKGLCREAREKGSVEAKLAAEKALQYMALLVRDQMDLNEVRAEMIEHILKIRAMLGRADGVK